MKHRIEKLDLDNISQEWNEVAFFCTYMAEWTAANLKPTYGRDMGETLQFMKALGDRTFHKSHRIVEGEMIDEGYVIEGDVRDMLIESLNEQFNENFELGEGVTMDDISHYVHNIPILYVNWHDKPIVNQPRFHAAIHTVASNLLNINS